MSKQRRNWLNRNKRTRSRRSFIRNGVEQLESRVLPGSFLDLLAGAAIAASFDLLPKDYLASEELSSETESEADVFAWRDRSANALLQTDLWERTSDQAPLEVRTERSQADTNLATAPVSQATTNLLVSASLVDSFFTGNQFVTLAPSPPPAAPAAPPSGAGGGSSRSSFGGVGSGVGSGSGQGYNVTGAELPQSSGSAPSMPSWMMGEGEGNSSESGSGAPTSSGSGSGVSTATGPGSASASGSGGAPATSMSCAPLIAPSISSLPDVNEGEYFSLNLTLPPEADSMQIDWGDGAAQTSYYTGYDVGYQYYDDDISPAAQDDYSVTLTVTNYCGEMATSNGTITVHNVDPSAEDDTVTVSADSTVTIRNVLENDWDVSSSDPLTVTSVDGTSTTGHVTLVNGTIIYDPNGNFDSLARDATATDSFTYTVEDDDTGSDTGTVTVTITGANHAPTAIALDNTDIEENKPSGTLVANLTATDADSDVGYFSLTSGAGDDDNAMFSIENDHQLTTAAILDFESKAAYKIRIRVHDGWGGSFEKPVTINVTDKNESDSRDFTVSGKYMDADWDFFGNPNGVTGDDTVGSWSQTLAANCNDIGKIDIDPRAMLPNSTAGDLKSIYNTDIDYASSGESATVQLSSSFLWDGNDPGFWDSVGIIATGAGIGGSVAGVATGANPVTVVIGVVIGAAAGSGVVIGGHVFGENPMGSAGDLTMTIACHRAPPELWGVGAVTDKWLPAWGVSMFAGPGSGGINAVAVVSRGQFGHGYQTFVAHGFVYHDPSTNYLAGQITADTEIESTPSPES